MIGWTIRRLRRQDGEGGFALLFVLFVTTMVMIGTASMLVVTAGNVVPAKRSQDTAAALAAAQSGIQAYLAELDANCPPTSIAQCTWLSNQGSAPITQATENLSLGNEAFSTKALNTVSYFSSANNGLLRLVSTGTSPAGLPAGSPNATSRTVTADVSGTPNPLALTYFSNYETIGKAFLDNYYGARTIPITNLTDANAAGLPILSTVNWAGAANSAIDSDSVCNKLYYDNPTGTPGRATIESTETDLPLGADYAETGTTQTPTQKLTNASSPVTRYAACWGSFTRGTTFTGPVASRDAFQFSNREWGSTAGPNFSLPAGENYPALWTAWTTADTPALPDATKPYVSDRAIGATPTGSTKFSSNKTINATLPTSLGPVGATCTYSGPTTISLSGTTATVTSPLTSPGSGACYTLNAAGQATVPVTTTAIYVKDSNSALPAAGLTGLIGTAGGDLTYYSPSRGDAYVQGTLTGGKLSVVADDDVIVTGDIKATNPSGSQANGVDPASGEKAWAPGFAAIDLVANQDVRIAHPVTCATGNVAVPDTTGTNTFCSNDITGLYSTKQSGAVVQSDGTLKSVHPSLQYCNILGGTPTNPLAGSADCTTDQSSQTTQPVTRRIDAAVFALNGSLYTDNFDRGRAMGTLQINGGLYQNHRGAVGEQWEIPTATSTRHNSGYQLQINYLSYLHAGLPYVPQLQGADPSALWGVVSLSSGGTP